MRIIVGLGNPEEKYIKTRHNAGFMAVDALAEKLGLSWGKNKKFFAETASGNDFILVKPQTFMNNSGQAVQAILKYYKITPSPETLIVIHDDIDIMLGKYKISVDSRAAGHNGVQSIIDYLKTKNFRRIRIGIRPIEKSCVPTDKFVLEKFKNKELNIIDKVIREIVEKII
jgi:PTH1 family peptidyl-tRNA hydrolase